MTKEEFDKLNGLTALDVMLNDTNIKVSIERMHGPHHGYRVSAYARLLPPKYGNEISANVDDDDLVTAIERLHEISIELQSKLRMYKA